MFLHEKKVLTRITKKIKKRIPEMVISIYAFGSKVRGDHNEGSDFDILIIVKDKTPELESLIISIFVDEELKSGLSFTPLIKDIKVFEMEKNFNTPFYENILKEGISL